LLLILEECCELWEEELKIENASDEPPQGIKTGKEARGILQSKQSKVCPLTVSGLFYFTENEQHSLNSVIGFVGITMAGYEDR
jgi:hypothetical protein